MTPWSACQQRQLPFIAEFTSDIRHKPGQENMVADTLSRPPPATAQPTSSAPTAEDWPEEGLVTPERPILAAIAEAQAVDVSAMAAAQRSCPGMKEMMNSNTLQITTQAVGDASLLRDVSTGVFRQLVPIQYREAVFQSLHSIHHPRVRGTCPLIAARFCWPQMAKAITLMARACLFCQRGKGHNGAEQGSYQGLHVVSEQAKTSPFQQKYEVSDCSEGGQQLPVEGGVSGAHP
jgi:hypothetical protein